MIEKDQSDKYLIERYRSGDRSTLALLVSRWHRTFCEKAFWVLRDKELAKDVAQECWIIIIKKLHTLKKAESFKSWALRIIYTQAIDSQKRRLKNLHELKRINKNLHPEFIDNDENKDRKKKVLIGIQELSKDKQDIIRLFYVEEYSIKEISLFLNVPMGTVKSRLFKAREKLKSLIKS